MTEIEDLIVKHWDDIQWNKSDNQWQYGFVFIGDKCYEFVHSSNWGFDSISIDGVYAK